MHNGLLTAHEEIEEILKILYLKITKRLRHSEDKSLILPCMYTAFVNISKPLQVYGNFSESRKFSDMKGSYLSAAHNSVTALKCKFKHTHCKRASHHGHCTYTVYVLHSIY